MKIITDCTKSYLSGVDAVEDCGYKEIGVVYYNRNFKSVKRPLLEKDGKLYYYKGMDHFNTTIYSVTVNKVASLKGEYTIEKWCNNDEE